MFFRNAERKTDAGEPSSSLSPAPETSAVTPASSSAVLPSAPVSGANPAAELSPDEAKRRLQFAKQMAASFGELVMLLMRSPADRQYQIGDLDWLAAPAIMSGQFALAEAQAKDTGVVTPVGAVLWAFVSPEVDARLSDIANPLKLEPNEWRAGDIPWIVLAAGDNRVLAGLLDKLNQSAFKGKQPKMRLRGPDGKVSVGTIAIQTAPIN